MEGASLKLSATIVAGAATSTSGAEDYETDNKFPVFGNN